MQLGSVAAKGIKSTWGSTIDTLISWVTNGTALQSRHNANRHYTDVYSVFWYQTHPYRLVLAPECDNREAFVQPCRLHVYTIGHYIIGQFLLLNMSQSSCC